MPSNTIVIQWAPFMFQLGHECELLSDGRGLLGKMSEPIVPVGCANSWDLGGAQCGIAQLRTHAVTLLTIRARLLDSQMSKILRDSSFWRSNGEP
jgi:hypothetical protein